MKKIAEIQNIIFEQAKSHQFAGYDPFDGLNSRWFNTFPSLRDSLIGLCWIQFFKRSPINMRPILGVPEGRNPKGVALFILGMLEQYKVTGDKALLIEAESLANWLVTQCCDKAQWGTACWGYHFDWKARAFFVPKGKPNVITTIYVSRALYDLGTHLGRQDLMDIALSSADFIVNHLYTKLEARQFFAYIPGEMAFVHNASLWGAAWVAFVASKTGNEYYAELALKVASQSVKEQASNGSWVYGDRHHHQFIDGFHTGYNLEALYEIKKSLDTNIFDSAIELGLTYYKNNFFESDGTAKYYDNNRYPLDPHSVAQGIITLLKVGKKKEDKELAGKIINKAIDDLYIESKQHFLYQKTQRFENKINYIRWTQAWMYYSFSLYLKELSGD
ncbi:hypothetical protein [Vibrio aestuarianus]|uniref:Aspartate-semialdehyde dehydrogenase n=1 Tax=Vibrio aestuarianus TaxID=28171 RepID=A0A9X4EXQ9_9VIBR|nr:hypothetical protein [Vibrio aestuarianus]KOE82955.1 aspartate-semialdehyde dehydrogenase [Vibrio alginolyticus]MDE1209560.1 aspartate-semialdehyde dehydrogenase [Vibrio aestuarianus]MDE1242750.1 aspartate-semialdehyde dehydrogenase [Vibrio aestuarianus]MDE1253807.1 aspartate-semialdehyde dehydrogenase [Vibrio aestuarianus]MDE1263231.1 aspartate-semialdehyde dehydrogenase [Vibrio aestuarianus]